MRMKSAKWSMSAFPVSGSTASSGSATLSYFASSAALPLGGFSFGNRRLVMPISFRYASPANASSVACCAFQPKRPTRVLPLATSVTTEMRPDTLSGFGRIALRMITASGIASISPAPNSGVVSRFATMFALAGTTSWVSGSIADCCRSEPPCASSGSKRPLAVLPKRVSTIALAPPIAGTEWHATQDTLLKTGPSPLAAVSSSWKSSRPSAKSASCAAVRFCRGSPNFAPRLGRTVALLVLTRGARAPPEVEAMSVCAMTLPRTAAVAIPIVAKASFRVIMKHSYPDERRSSK